MPKFTLRKNETVLHFMQSWSSIQHTLICNGINPGRVRAIETWFAHGNGRNGEAYRVDQFVIEQHP